MKKILSFIIPSLITFSSFGTMIYQSVKAVEKENIEQNETKDFEAMNKDIISVYPGNGQTVSILKSPVINYIKAMKEKAPNNDYYISDNATYEGVTIKDFYSIDENYQKSKKVVLYWVNNEGVDISNYVLYVSLNEDFTDAKTYSVSSNTYELENLYAATRYYWKVTSSDGKYSSSINNFITEDYVRMLSTDNIVNVRDIGGRMTSFNKRVKQGIIFRGGEVVDKTYTTTSNATHSGNISEKGLDVFNNEMKIGVELDFRGEEESNYLTSSNIGDNVEYVRESIGAYTAFNKDSNLSMFKEIFEYLANANEKHVYFHCWGGADRTGTVGFLINGLLGVSYTDLIIDYEITSFSKNLKTKENMNDNVAYFEDFINEFKTSYCGYDASTKKCSKTISEGVKDYLINRLGFTSNEVNQMINNLLED